MTDILGSSHMGMNAPSQLINLMEMQRWANGFAEQQAWQARLQSSLQHQHPRIDRGWSQHHLDALLDVELGL